MTRKLTVTVFAMSLTLVGCGSSSTTKPDVGADVKPASPDVAGSEAAKLDVAVVPGPEAGQTPDVGQPDVALVDTATPDVSVADAGVDAGDAGSLVPDTRPADARPDGGIDAPRLDAPDAPAVDASDAGDGSSSEAGAASDGGRG